MDDAARGERLGPERISEASPPVPFVPRLARIFFSTAVFCATYIIAWMASSPPRSDLACLVAAIIVGTVAGWRSNGRSLLWLWAETLGRPQAAEAVLGVRPPDLLADQMKRVPASALEPGDWISDWANHQHALRDNQGARERMARDLDEQMTGMPEPYYDSTQIELELPEPVITSHQVLAVLPVKGGMFLELGLAGADSTRVSPNWLYYRQAAMTPRPQPQASLPSAAVGKLMGFLPRDTNAEPERERDLVLRLVGDGYDEPVIWNAVRACRAAGLISVERARGWTAEVIGGIFKPRATAPGHEDCLIKLTKLGWIWAEAGDPERIATPTHWEFVMGDKIAGDKVMGDKYESGNVGAVGPNARAENVRFAQVSPQLSDAQVLAAQLAQVLVILEAKSRGTTQDLTEIEAIRSARTAADADDASRTMAHLARAGKWALEAATSAGAAVAATAIQRAIGL